MSIENPPAFPQSLAPEGPFGGMTLRDYFAGNILASLPAFDAASCSDGELQEMAVQIYRIATAMLTARQKGTPDE